MTTPCGNSIFSGTPRGKYQPTPSPPKFHGQQWPRPSPGAAQSRGPRCRQGQQCNPAPKRLRDGQQGSSSHHSPVSFCLLFSLPSAAVLHSLPLSQGWERCFAPDPLPLVADQSPSSGEGHSASLCLASLTPVGQAHTTSSRGRGRGAPQPPCHPPLVSPGPHLKKQGGRRRGDGTGGEDAPSRVLWSTGSRNQTAGH